MIKEGLVTHPQAELSFSSWQVQDTRFNEVLVATVTTILAYQVGALCFDVCVGFKRRGEAKLTDIFTVLIAEESSVHSVIANLFDSERLLRWRFLGLRSSYHNPNRVRKGVAPWVLAKFAFLVIIVPVVNLLAIILALEVEQTKTFGDVGFGGVALGIQKDDTDLSVSTTSLECSRFDTSYGRRETPIAQFYSCYFPLTDPLPEFFPMSLNISQSASQAISVEFASQFSRFTGSKHVDLNTEGKLFRLKQVVTVEDGMNLMRLTRKKLMEFCLRPNPAAASLPPTVLTRKHSWSISEPVACEEFDEVLINKEAGSVLASALDRVTLVNSDRFEVIHLEEEMPLRINSEPNFSGGDDLVLLRRRRSILPFAFLSVLTLCVVVIRILLQFVLNNDVHIGVETILKDVLGIECCDSMLQDSTLVTFSDYTNAGRNGNKYLFHEYNNSDGCTSEGSTSSV